MTVLKELMKALLSSKRFVTLLCTVAILLTHKLGLDLDPETITHLVTAAVAYIGFQSLSDTWGKGAIEAKAKALNGAGPIDEPVAADPS